MIGIFDSGFGGLTVMRAILRKLPSYNYFYLGDNARAPYGNKSQSTIYEYTQQAVAFLFERGCKIIILACNTASAKALRRIQQEYLPKHYPERRVLGVVIPVCEAAVNSKDNNRIGIIGTIATITSRVYERELLKLRDDIEIFSKSTPLLVPLVEAGWVGRPETNMILKKYLRPLKQKQIKVLILGCTHYPFLTKDIKRIMGKSCQTLDTPSLIALKFEEYINRHPELEIKLSNNRQRHFLTTDDPVYFKDFGKKFFDNCSIAVDKINLI